MSASIPTLFFSVVSEQALGQLTDFCVSFSRDVVTDYEQGCRACAKGAVQSKNIETGVSHSCLSGKSREGCRRMFNLC